MRKLIVLTLLFSLTQFTLAQSGSVVLHRGPGDISQAQLSAGGLIVNQETSAEIIDTRDAGLANYHAALPQLQENQRVVFSPTGRNAMIVTFEGAGDYYTAQTAEIYDVGTGEYTKTLETPGFSEAVLGHTWGFTGINRNINISDKAQLLFFDKSSSLTATVDFPSVTTVKREFGITGAISGSRGLVFFDNFGKELKEFGPCQFFDFRGSSYGGEEGTFYLICSHTDGNKIGHYNSMTGAEWQNEYGSEVFRDVSMSYSYKKEMLITAVSKHELYVIDGSNGEIVWRQTAGPKVSFTSCAMGSNGSDGQSIAWGWEIDEGREVHYSQRHTRGGYSIASRGYGKSQFTVTSEELEYSNWNVFTPSVEFSPYGLFVQTMDEVRYVKLNEERR